MNKMSNSINLFLPNSQVTTQSTNDTAYSFVIDNIALENIKNNSYDSLSVNLPKNDGTTKNLRLRKVKLISNELLKSTQGDNSNITKVKPIYTTYKVIENEKSVGVIGFGIDKVTGSYIVDGEPIILYKNTDNLYIASTKELVIPEDFQCGMDDETLEVTSKDLQRNVEKENTYRPLSQNEQYCVKVVMDVAVDTYNDIISEGGTVQEYLEYTIINLNTYYQTDFNDDFVFELVGYVEWTTTDPWNLNSPGYTQNQAVGTYYNNNHTTLLPGIEYNVIHQLNTVNIGGLKGISNFLGIYINGMDISPKNVYNCWSLNVSYPYGSDIFDLWLNAHELGHAVVGLHTWNSTSYYQGTYSYFTGWSGRNTSPCNCNSCCGSNPDCHTIMSYCSAYLPIQKFTPQRVLDGYDYAAQYGQHLICNSTPDEPYLELSLTNTNITSPNFTYTVELKDCNTGQWFTYGDNYTYSDFPLYIVISTLPFNANCYEYRVTIDSLPQSCQGTETISYGDIEPPNITPTIGIDTSVTPTPTISTSETVLPTPTLTPGNKTIYVHYPNK
jgi:hypothetical protein